MSSTSTIVIGPDVETVVLCGGPYSNFASVTAFLDATSGYAERFCLGDLGGFGPLPNCTIDLLRAGKVRCIQGNYDHAVGFGETECGCGYLDPNDRLYAQISFDYTLKNTSHEHRQWLSGLPQQMILEWSGQRILLCHGSPDQVSEFVWESEAKSAQIEQWLDQHGVTGICATHSGLPWIRRFRDGRFWFNVGVLGRPAHEGKTHVYYGRLEWPKGARLPLPELVPLNYDPVPVIESMRREGLPEKFGEALRDGIWTTCFNIMPPTELEVRDRFKKI